MSQHLTIHPIGKSTVVEFRNPSLMDPIELESIAKSLYELVDDQDRRQIVLDFEKVQQDFNIPNGRRSGRQVAAKVSVVVHNR